MISRFIPTNYQHVAPAKSVAVAGDATAGSPITIADWAKVAALFGPMVWAWFDQHKNQKVTKLFGFFTITIGSFGIAEQVITSIFGPRPSV